MLLWERAKRSAGRRLVPPGRLPRARRDARGVDPPAARAEGGRARAGHLEQLETLSDPTGTRASGSSQPTYLGLVPLGPRPRACRRTPRWHRVDDLPRWRSTTERSRSPDASACARSSRTRTSALRSRRTTFTLSELRDVYVAALGHGVSTTNLKRVLLRRQLLEATGERRPPGPAAAGRRSSSGSASARSKSRIRLLLCDRLAD